MEQEARRYPVGIQTFSRLRKENYLYVDKTDLVWQMTKESPYVFLIRQMLRFHTDITAMDDIIAPAIAFDRPMEAKTNALPLLYQGGYLTIKGYDADSQAYTFPSPTRRSVLDSRTDYRPHMWGSIRPMSKIEEIHINFSQLPI